MRISDWSSDVCSSDLQDIANGFVAVGGYADAVALVHGTGSRAYGWRRNGGRSVATASPAMMRPEGAGADLSRPMASNADRKRVVWGKSVSVRVDLGGRRIIQEKKQRKCNISNN